VAYLIALLYIGFALDNLYSPHIDTFSSSSEIRICLYEQSNSWISTLYRLDRCIDHFLHHTPNFLPWRDLFYISWSVLYSIIMCCNNYYFYFFFNFSKISIINVKFSESKLVVRSSARIILESSIKLLMIATLCFWPPEICLTFFLKLHKYQIQEAGQKGFELVSFSKTIVKDCFCSLGI